MIVFNLKEKKENNDRDRVIEMIGDMGVRVCFRYVSETGKGKEKGGDDNIKEVNEGEQGNR